MKLSSPIDFTFSADSFYKYLKELPAQIEYVLKRRKSISLKLDDFETIKNIVYCGMGGSGFAGDLLWDYIKTELKLPFYINKTSFLPRFVDKNSLIIIASYSGNTQEMINCFRAAINSKAKLVVFTSGGKLKEMAQHKKVKVIALKQGLPPRFAIGYLFIYSYLLLVKCKLLSPKYNELNSAILLLYHLIANKYGLEIETARNPAKDISFQLYKKIVLIYGSNKFKSVLYRWKSQLAENAKHQSFMNAVPELYHNEIESWNKPFLKKQSYIVVLLKTPDIDKRFECFKRIIAHKSSIIEILPEGKNKLEQLLSLVLLGDFVSYYLCLLKGVNPLELKLIDKLKRSQLFKK